jgi:hypothetical protein
MSADWQVSKPIFVSWMWERTVDLAEAEIRWCERTAKLIEEGTPYMPSAPDAGWPSDVIIKFD